MKKRKYAIGVFDSGFGGLTILKAFTKELPEYQYLYLGDSARAPYGNRSQGMIYQLTKEAVDFLFTKGAGLIIVACNSASSEALRKIQQEYLPKHYPGKRVLGVLIPAAEEAVRKTKTGKIGVLATEGTVKSGAFIREVKKLDPQAKIYQRAAPLLAPAVEAGEERQPATHALLSQYLLPLQKKKIDTLVLGCTHYGVFERPTQQILGRGVVVISEGKVVAKKLKEYLQKHPEVEEDLKKSGRVIFFSTDLTEKFTRLGGRFFGRKITVRKATLPL